MSASNSHHRGDDGFQPTFVDNNIVEADPDPIAEKVAHLLRRAAGHAAIARAQQRFADKDFIYGQELTEQGLDDEGAAVTEEAIGLMASAEHFLDEALKEQHEVKELLDQRRREVSRALKEMPNQSLLTLRDAISTVREYIEEMSEQDIQALVETSHQSKQIVNHQRDVAVVTGQHIEIILINIEEVRRDPVTLGKQLMTFVTIAIGFANYLPKLMELVKQLSRVLQQFHP